MTKCRLCDKDAVDELLNPGPQPICNRFLKKRDEPEESFSLTVGQCRTCGLVQLIDDVPAAELLPPYEWISYNEPEGHLDTLTDIIAGSPALEKQSVICGVSFKDDSLLRRLNDRGIARAWRIDPQADLG
ncbi:hypothetical protein ACFLQR_05465, partial [Verrucomicrobiota bacterium]